MNTVSSQLPTNLFLPQTVSAIRGQAAELSSLRLQQQVVATIVELDKDEAVLEIGGKSYRTPAHESMQPGQTLQLQVVATEPSLEMKVLGFSRQDQLGQLFSLLSQPYDWSKLGEQIQNLAKESPELRTLANLFRQLSQVLTPGAKVPDEVAEAVKRLHRHLQPQAAEAQQQNSPKALPGFELAPKRPSADQPVALHNWSRLLTHLKEHIAEGQNLAAGPKARGGWYAQTRELIGQLQTTLRVGALSSPVVQTVRPLLHQLQRLPQVTPQLGLEIRQLDTMVQRSSSPAVMSQDFVANDIPVQTSGLRVELPPPPSGNHLSPPNGGARVTEGVEPLEKMVRQLLAALPADKEKMVLPPKLAGQIEGMLQPLVAAEKVSLTLLPQVEGLLQQIARTPDAVGAESFRQKLGVLSLLLGFSVSKIGKRQDVNEKIGLLQHGLQQLQERLAGKGEEPLKRLELLQWCRERLSDEQVQFIPLPFNDLEEGYLLVRQYEYGEQKKPDSGNEVQLSMALRLSAIGNVRVDMLYDRSGLRLQIAGEDNEKMNYLEQFSTDLEGALRDVTLVSLGFRDDAVLPTPQLKKRVFPEADRLLNMRA